MNNRKRLKARMAECPYCHARPSRKISHHRVVNPLRVHEYVDEQTQELVTDSVGVDEVTSTLLIKTKHPFRVPIECCPVCGRRLKKARSK